MKNQIPGRRLDFEKIFWYNIKKTIFTRTGFRGVPVAYGVHPTGVTWVFGKILGAFNISFQHMKNPYGVYRAGNRDRTAVPGPLTIALKC